MRQPCLPRARVRRQQGRCPNLCGEPSIYSLFGMLTPYDLTVKCTNDEFQKYYCEHCGRQRSNLHGKTQDP